MPDLQKFHARICWTAAGVLIHEGKVLLVKHKKVGWWLSPGGHVEENETPHQCAEREFWEEAGIKVTAFDVIEKTHSVEVGNEVLPLPFQSDLHWVSKENFDARMASGDTSQPHCTKLWPKGCEQHLGFLFLVRPVDPDKVEFQQNIEESDGIGWFTPEEVAQLDTPDSIKHEVYYAFSLVTRKAHGAAHTHH